MVDYKKEKDCCGCRACEKACPVGAITMCEDDYGFLYPKINGNLCVKCNICDNVCGFVDVPEKETENKIFAAINKDNKIRSNSTSGGVFYLLANEIIASGGVVYGAAYNDELYVHHDRADTMESCERFMGSKYVQSDTLDTFASTKRDLDTGLFVLYSGTPCQIASLKKFLQKDYENLITVEVVCHGVPNARVWKEFIALAEKKTGHKIIGANFRDKSIMGWHRPKTVLTYDDRQKHYFCGEQSFFQMFNTNLFLRPSCLHCKFINYVRPADISIADYWGIDRFANDFDDNGGTSLVLVNNQKGLELFEKIKPELKWRETSKEFVYQGRLQGRSYINPHTDLFWKEYNKYGLEYVLKKYTEYSSWRTFIKKVARKINNFWKRSL